MTQKTTRSVVDDHCNNEKRCVALYLESQNSIRAKIGKVGIVHVIIS